MTEGIRMHIDNSNWLGLFKEQEELAAQQALDDPPEQQPPRLRLVSPPDEAPEST